MSCSNCPEKERISPDASGLKYSLVSGVESVTGSDGRTYSLDECLIPAPKKPVSGWGVEFRIFGQSVVVNGRNPRQVFLKSKELFDLNEIIYTDVNLWFNLNIQWVSRAVNKYQKVTLDTLLNIATKNY